MNANDKHKIRQDIVKAIKFQTNCKQQSNLTDRTLFKKIKTAQKFTSDNKDIFFAQSDKGNVTVCLEKAEYIRKINELLSDNNVYKEIKENPLKKLQNDVYKILKNFNENPP